MFTIFGCERNARAGLGLGLSARNTNSVTHAHTSSHSLSTVHGQEEGGRAEVVSFLLFLPSLTNEGFEHTKRKR